ncbi:hypothetical protein KR059_005302 [Drosophila kikkawai]|nr:hypothetical protein KR059_001220 [Drosophila kikkawai]KAH8304269.1 hypothetical protein KR059_005302 [Drosophila kikkawai]
MGLPVFRDCCCCELKWGVLTVGIVDIILTLCLGGGKTLLTPCQNLLGYTGAARIVWFLALVIHVAHIVACVCVIVSVFKPDKRLVIPYLITGICRAIIDTVFLILICLYVRIGDALFLIVIIVAIIVLGIYFWLVIYSWFRKLGGSTPAD